MEEKKDSFSLVARGCRVSSQERSPRARELITAKHAARVSRGIGGLPAPTWALAAAAAGSTPGAPGRAAPRTRRVPTASEWCGEHFNQKPSPSLSFPLRAAFSPEVAGAGGQKLEREEGEKKPARVSSPC